MGEKLSESDLQMVNDLDPETSKHNVLADSIESPESEVKNDNIVQEAIKDETSSSVPSNELSSSEDLESTSSLSDEASDLKRNSPNTKRDSLGNTTAKLEIGSNSRFDSEQERSSNNREIRPTTMSSRSSKMNRLRDIGRKFFEDVPNKIRDMFNSVLPRNGFSMDSSGATSSFYGEGSSRETQNLQPQLLTRTPLLGEVTSQAGISGSVTGNSINGSNILQNGSVFFFNQGRNLFSVHGSKVSNGKASTSEISYLNDDQSSPTKKAKLQLERETKDDESTDSSSSIEEVNISPEKEAEDADMSEN